VAPALPIRLLAWGALGTALHIGLARFGYGVVLPSLRGELGLGYTAAGVLNAVHLGAYLLGTLTGAALSARLGLRGLGRLGHWLVVAGAVLCVVAEEKLVLGAGRLLTGLGAGWGVIAILVTVLGGIAENARMQASVLIWTGMAAALLGCGLAVPWLLAPGLWRWVFAAAGLAALVLALGFPAPRAAPAASGGDGFRLASVATPRWAWLVGTYFCFGLGYIAYATFAGAKLAAAGAATGVVMATWSAVGAATLAGSLLTLWVLGRAQLRAFALAGAMGLAAGGAAVAALPGATAAFAGASLVGLGMAAIPALITAAARTRSSAADYARAFSVATAALGLGQLLGPVLAGALADALGTAAAPLFGAACYAAGMVAALVDRHASATGAEHNSERQ
jgi:predicted MFS family arabinose efflux permease